MKNQVVPFFLHLTCSTLHVVKNNVSCFGRNFIVWLCLLLCVWPIHSYGQKENRSDLEQANHYYENEQWSLAIHTYESYLSRNPDYIPAEIKMGKALMKVNRLEEATQKWKSMMKKESNLPAEVYFLAARSDHQLGLYDDAEDNYRSYLKHQGDNADLDLLSYYLKQIGAAKSAGVAESQYLIENAGPSLNSDLDEFHPVYSPNYDQRFYYSLHDLKGPEPIRSAPPIKASIMSAEVKQGEWVPHGPMDTSLVSGEELHLLDFSENGQRVFFTRPSEGESRITYQKTFENIPAQTQVSEWIHPVYNSTLGDRDLFTINDSAFLFSSSRLKGYGGYDLYVTFMRLGDWVVQNLGSHINSPYDEIAPYLSRGGRDIYFSSNSVKSIGGYDIFFATFDDEMESWTLPVNMLPPINSGMNDVELRLSKDGGSAVFSSNRPGGHGSYDIYHVYFTHKKYSQNQINRPRYFYQVQAYRSFTSDGKENLESSRKPVYELPVIYFGTRPVVITPKIMTQLDRILEYGQLFPHTGILLDIFVDQKLDNDISLYRPVLVLKNVTDYLIDHGMKPARIQLRLYGNQYPKFASTVLSDDHKIVPVRSSNRRLEFRFTETENLPVQFTTPVSEQIDSNGSISPYQQWKERIKGLHFRIQLVQSQQLIKGMDYNQEDDLMLTVDENGVHYTYYTGIFETVDEARKKLNYYTSQGYDKADIVAYLGTTRMAGDKMTTDMIEAYPELKKFIIYQK